MATAIHFDRVELHRLRYEEHWTQRQCAEHFGVSSSAISKALKQLNKHVVMVAGLEAGHKVVSIQLDTLGQLAKINRNANEILESMMEAFKRASKALKDAEEGGLGEDGKSEIDISKLQKIAKNLPETALKATAEIREQLRLQIDIMKTLHDVQAVAEFQREVLGVVGDSNKCPHCKAAPITCPKCLREIDFRMLIIDNLKRARALRSGVTFRP